MKTTLTVAIAAVAMMFGAGIASANDKDAKNLHRSHHQTHALHQKGGKHYAAKPTNKHIASKHTHKHYASKHTHKHIASKHTHKHVS